MAEGASEESGGFYNMSSLFSLKGSYFERVEDVPEYVQQVSFCTSHTVCRRTIVSLIETRPPVEI